MQRNSHPVAWRPRGLSDALDSSDAFAGAMQQLQNLVPDPSTKQLWQCRPAATSLTNFTTAKGGINWNTPGFCSALKIFGNLAYGMISTARNAGKDEPFCYNLLTNLFVAVSGVTNANTPTSPATTGAWTPPTMALMGSKLVVTHPGFTGGANGYFGVFDISNPAAPAWSSGNLAGAVVFTVVPSAVAQFNSRLYFIQNIVAQPAVVFTDTFALNTTLASQVLTFGDNVTLTALGPLQLNNQLGGVVQSLMVFKATSNIYQITGDAALNNLSANALNITTGTLAPNTLVTTPKGLAFVSPDGLRIIDFNAVISDPIGLDGMGVTVPFIQSVVPSRMAAACAGNIIRVSTQNGNAAGSPNQEFWFDFARGIWSGPHTFPASQIQPYGKTFIEAPIAVTASLWQSDPVQSSTSTFSENGAQLTWNWVTANLPDNEEMTNNAMTETTLDLALDATIPNINVNFLDQNQAVLKSVQVPTPGGATVWGAFTWGASPWSGPPNSLAPRQLPWPSPIVFARGALQATGLSAAGVKVGTLHLRYQMLRYLTNLSAVA